MEYGDLGMNSLPAAYPATLLPNSATRRLKLQLHLFLGLFNWLAGASRCRQKLKENEPGYEIWKTTHIMPSTKCVGTYEGSTESMDPSHPPKYAAKESA